jgi:hypothetical protein
MTPFSAVTVHPFGAMYVEPEGVVMGVSASTVTTVVRSLPLGDGVAPGDSLALPARAPAPPAPPLAHAAT